MRRSEAYIMLLFTGLLRLLILNKLLLHEQIILNSLQLQKTQLALNGWENYERAVKCVDLDLYTEWRLDLTLRNTDSSRRALLLLSLHSSRSRRRGFLFVLVLAGIAIVVAIAASTSSTISTTVSTITRFFVSAFHLFSKTNKVL
jgi:hypothetical protein